MVTAGKLAITALLGPGAGRPPYLYVFLQKNATTQKTRGRYIALAAMEEYPGAYMRLLHNVF